MKKLYGLKDIEYRYKKDKELNMSSGGVKKKYQRVIINQQGHVHNR